jgi:hypothetical protein
VPTPVRDRYERSLLIPSHQHNSTPIERRSDARDKEEIVLDKGYVAGPQPAAFYDRIGRRLGIVDVAQHHIGSPYPEFAFLAPFYVFERDRVDDAGLHVGQKIPDGPGLGMNERTIVCSR